MRYARLQGPACSETKGQRGSGACRWLGDTSVMAIGEEDGRVCFSGLA
jgi:hypothetical protein